MISLICFIITYQKNSRRFYFKWNLIQTKRTKTLFVLKIQFYNFIKLRKLFMNINKLLLDSLKEKDFNWSFHWWIKNTSDLNLKINAQILTYSNWLFVCSFPFKDTIFRRYSRMFRRDDHPVKQKCLRWIQMSRFVVWLSLKNPYILRSMVMSTHYTNIDTGV